VLVADNAGSFQRIRRFVEFEFMQPRLRVSKPLCRLERRSM